MKLRFSPVLFSVLLVVTNACTRPATKTHGDATGAGIPGPSLPTANLQSSPLALTVQTPINVPVYGRYREIPVSGGKPPYKFEQIQGEAGLQGTEVLPKRPGLATIKVTDAEGATLLVPFNFYVPLQLELDAGNWPFEFVGAYKVLLPGQKIDVYVAGGVPPYSVESSSRNGHNLIDDNGLVLNIGKAPDTFRVVATDSIGNEFVQPVMVRSRPGDPDMTFGADRYAGDEANTLVRGQDYFADEVTVLQDDRIAVLLRKDWRKKDYAIKVFDPDGLPIGSPKPFELSFDGYGECDPRRFFADRVTGGIILVAECNSLDPDDETGKIPGFIKLMPFLADGSQDFESPLGRIEVKGRCYPFDRQCVSQQPTGEILILVKEYQFQMGDVLLRFKNGELDPSFGENGAVKVDPELGHFSLTEHKGVLRIYLTGSERSEVTRLHRLFVRALDASGHPIESFGAKGTWIYDLGHRPEIDHGFLLQSIRHVEALDNGNLAFLGEAWDDPFLLTVTETGEVLNSHSAVLTWRTRPSEYFFGFPFLGGNTKHGLAFFVSREGGSRRLFNLSKSGLLREIRLSPALRSLQSSSGPRRRPRFRRTLLHNSYDNDRADTLAYWMPDPSSSPRWARQSTGHFIILTGGSLVRIVGTAQEQSSPVGLRRKNVP